MQFPPSIDLCRSGYSRNLKGGQAPQTFDAWQRQRRKVRRRGVIDTVCWIVTKEQCGQLEQFHRQASGHYFQIDLPAYKGITRTAARFDGPLTINPVRDHFEITASLYIPQPRIMLDIELALAIIGITDSTFGDSLHDFIHNEWPLQWLAIIGITDSTFGDSLHDFIHNEWPVQWSPAP